MSRCRADKTPILTLDLATLTGWAQRSAAGVVTSGVARFDRRGKEAFGLRFSRFRAWLADRLEELRPRWAYQRDPVIAWEAPHHRGGNATRVLLGFETVVLEECAERDLRHCRVHTGTVKKHATGDGRASKAQMIAAAQGRWGLELQRAIESDDEADALCLLDWTLDEIGEGGR